MALGLTLRNEVEAERPVAVAVERAEVSAGFRLNGRVADLQHGALGFGLRDIELAARPATDAGERGGGRERLAYVAAVVVDRHVDARAGADVHVARTVGRREHGGRVERLVVVLEVDGEVVVIGTGEACLTREAGDVGGGGAVGDVEGLDVVGGVGFGEESGHLGGGSSGAGPCCVR